MLDQRIHDVLRVFSFDGIENPIPLYVPVFDAIAALILITSPCRFTQRPTRIPRINRRICLQKVLVRQFRSTPDCATR